MGNLDNVFTLIKLYEYDEIGEHCAEHAHEAAPTHIKVVECGQPADMCVAYFNLTLISGSQLEKLGNPQPKYCTVLRKFFIKDFSLLNFVFYY
jgi:hypothetical protein